MLRKLGLIIFTIMIFFLLMGTEYSIAQPKPSRLTNVALGKTVAGIGEFFTGGWGEGLLTDFCTITDNVFFTKGHQWDQGTVWWDEDMDQVKNSLTVFLGDEFIVKKIKIQVDNNDDYLISWMDKYQGYQELVVVPQLGWGMDIPIVFLRLNAVTNAFKIEQYVEGKGDGLYSVSEFQAYGFRHITEPIN